MTAVLEHQIEPLPVEAALATEDREIVIAAQRDASVEEPGLDDLVALLSQAPS